jgi:hypothetical protein
MYTHFAVTRQNISPDNLLLIIHNFSISSWNVQGLGRKYRDEGFLSNLKYDKIFYLKFGKVLILIFVYQFFAFFKKVERKRNIQNVTVVE